jgi:hypothetical protein
MARVQKGTNHLELQSLHFCSEISNLCFTVRQLGFLPFSKLPLGLQKGPHWVSVHIHCIYPLQDIETCIWTPFPQWYVDPDAVCEQFAGQ